MYNFYDKLDKLMWEEQANMITSIKKIKNIGVFKEYDTKTTGLEKDFTDYNLVYGLNAFGKSTLCDIFKDVESDTSDRIKRRLSIPCSEAKQEVLFQLSNGEGIVKLDDGIWRNNKLKGKIAIFDSKFVLKNVFDGTKLLEERTTKENFTQFILGDEGVLLAQEIEELKKNLKIEKARLNDLIPESQNGNSETAIKKYVNIKVTESLEELNAVKKVEQNKQSDKKKRDENQAKIQQINLFSKLENSDFDRLIRKLEIVSEVLKLYYEISANALITFQNHLKENCHSGIGAKDWIVKGIEYLQNGSNCPFCGQNIANSSLIGAYDEYLSEDYMKFQNEIAKKIISVDIAVNYWDVFVLSKSIQSIITQLESIKAVCVTDNLDIYIKQLNEQCQEVSELEQRLGNEFLTFRIKAQNMIVSKRVLASVSINLELDELFEIKRKYDDEFGKVNNTIALVNDIIDKIKSSCIKDNENLETASIQKLKDIDEKIIRINEGGYCEKWLEQYNLVLQKTEEVNQKSKDMEENQKQYLDNLFDKIDAYFQLYGGKKFKIENGSISNRGNKKTVGITIKFMKQLITENTDSIFSESDKRALALSIFMAKLDCIDATEKEKMIIIYDDPITSFDDNRMKNVEMSIMGKSRGVEQTFVFTHNFNFAKSISDKNADNINCYGINRIKLDSHGLFDLNPKEYFADGFGKKFNNILKFNNCESDDMTENDLRIFLEEYLGVVFAKQYEEHNINSLKLGERIDKLNGLGLISNDVKLILHDYRNELNSGSHTFKGSTIEDDRIFSIAFIDYLFKKVQMQ